MIKTKKEIINGIEQRIIGIKRVLAILNPSATAIQRDYQERLDELQTLRDWIKGLI